MTERPDLPHWQKVDIKDSTYTNTCSSKLPFSEKQFDLKLASTFAAGEITCFQPKSQVNQVCHPGPSLVQRLSNRQRLFLLTLGSYLHPRNCSWFLLLFDGHLFHSVSSDYHVLSTNLFACNQASFISKKTGMSRNVLCYRPLYGHVCPLHFSYMYICL